MIKVNLAKTHNYTSAGTQTAIAMDKAALEANNTHPAVKIVLMLLATFCLYIYESYNLSQLRVRLAEKNEQVREIQEEVKQFGSVSAVVDSLIAERQKLNDQLTVIQNISKKRSYKLRGIKLFQENLLEDIWLSEMAVTEKSLIFKGFSRTPTSVQQIVKNLNSNDFIESAINRDLKKVVTGGDVFNSFDIEAKVKP